MATSYLERSQLRLMFETGMDPVTQKPMLKNKTFSNIKTNATPDQLHTVAKALSSLQQHSLYQVQRVDQSNIESE